MKERLIELVYWLVKNNPELRGRAIGILAGTDIGVITNVGLHGTYYYRKDQTYSVIFNNTIVPAEDELSQAFLEAHQRIRL